MFESLIQNLTKTFDKIKGKGAITEKQITSTMRDIRISLLESDVALPIVRNIITNIHQKAKDRKVIESVSPSQMIIKIVNDEIVNLLSPGNNNEASLQLTGSRPVNILVVGLQGSGKTTASMKLALKIKSQNKKVLLVSLDTYRPAAREQLEILAKSIGVHSLHIIKEESPTEITTRAISKSKLLGYDVVIYDTAGRLHVDKTMLQEAVDIQKMVSAKETLLVIDSMIGQDAMNIASIYEEHLHISGIILSRIDGDARGGAALSIRHATGKPIKFLSTGEKAQDFEIFNAKQIASRILDTGDVLSLVEKAASVINQKEAENSAKKLKKGTFDLNDYILQIKTIRQLGGFSTMIKMIPGISKWRKSLEGNADDSHQLFKIQEAIVLSMTKREIQNPSLLNASRKRRIAMGSGSTVQQINRLLKQFKQISTTIKKVSTMDKKSLIRTGIGHFLP